MVRPNKTRTIKEYSAVALSTTDTTQSTEYVDPVDNIIGFDLDLSVTMTGTLTGPQPITKAIKRLTITGKGDKTILDVGGSDLDKLYQLLNPKGHYVSVPNSSTSAQVWQAFMNLPIELKYQPAKIQVTMAPYSDLATSGATGGTVTLKLRALFGEARPTLFVYRKSLSIVSGDNTLGLNVTNDKNTVLLGFAIGTESNINNISFSTDGVADEYSKLPLQQLIDLEKQFYVSGHTTGLFNLFTVPFRSSQTQTKLNVNGAGSDTLTLYQVALD